MLLRQWLKIGLLGVLAFVHKIRVNALFFGSMGSGCGCGCCGCCGMMSMPSLPSFGCSGQMSGGCSSSGPAQSSGCNSGGYSLGGLGNGNVGCSGQQTLQPFSNPRPLPQSGYALPQSQVLPTFSPQLPPVYSVAPSSTNPTESSENASPSYGPFNGNVPSSNAPLPYGSLPPPPPPSSSSYQENIDLNDNVEKPQIGNEITGIDTLTDKTIKSTASPDLYEDKLPDVDDYGDVTSNRSGKGGDKKNDLLTADYSDNSFKSKVSGLPSDLMNAADQTSDPKCSSETLRIIMQENIVSSPTISKQLIFSAGRLAFGQTIDVICSRNKFSYTVVSSKIFCEASRGRITCFAYVQP